MALSSLRVILLVLVLCTGLTACSEKPEPFFQRQLLVFGTVVDISLWGVDPALAETAFADLERDLNAMHRLWHAWHPGALGRVNQLIEATGWFTVNPSVLPLLQPAQTLSLRSDGLFNPALGHLVELWGFHADERPNAPPPSAQAIQALLARKPSMADLDIQGVRMRSSNSAVKLDFGGFAKGFAVDRAIEHLRNLGIENAIVNAGGDLRAIGQRGNRAWRIGIRAPKGDGVIAALEVKGDESVFTSGSYERYFEFEGTRYHHIIDPRTGYPARGTVSVTVAYPDAATADAAATALFVAGPSDWYRIAKAMGVTQVLLIDEQGVAHMSPAMAQRIKFESEPAEIRVSDPL